ncbi:MAG: LuxR C-terminal-related transcriptional regulator [Chloroflexia bacterium]
MRTSAVAPLIATKLYLPGPRHGLVPRARLLARLDAGLGGMLTLVSAPAGSGKTTLVADWVRRLQEAGRPMAWLSLDAGDSDPARFMRYLVTAVRLILPGAGDSLLAMLDSTSTVHAPSLMAGLVNELSAGPTGGVLVLDDYHTIANLEVHEALAFLVAHLPFGFHLAIATREDPPLPLARMRARAQLSELRVADLRFTTEEAAEFLRSTMGLHLLPAEVAAIEARTEGWIAGLQLAALSMRDHADAAGFISAFTGTNRYILDYLVEEVLNAQPATVQTFLLRTSVLGKVSTSLCDAVLSGEDLPNLDGVDSQAMLRQIERANLFLTPLDMDRTWYRYHQLFADLLLSRLDAADPGLSTRIRGRAARWYAENGMLAEAIEHALLATDFPYAAGLISRSLQDLARQPRSLEALRRWLQALPEDVIRSDAQLCLDYAWVLASTGRLDGAEEYGLRVEQHLEAAGKPPESRAIEADLAVLLTFVSSARFDLDRCVAMADRALDLLPEDRYGDRASVEIFRANAYLVAERLQPALDAYAAAEQLGRAAGDTLAVTVAINNMAAVHMLTGDLHEAARAQRRALQLPDSHFVPATGMAHVGLGQVLVEWNRLDEALEHLRQGVALLEAIRDWNTNLVEGYAALARALWARGEEEAAAQAVQQAAQLAEGSDRVRITRPAEWLAVTQWLRTGDLEPARRWAERAEAAPPQLPTHQQEIETMTLARVYLATNNSARTLALLSKASERAASGGRKGRLAEILALQSLALREKHQMGEALRVLSLAISIAEPGGYLRVFLDADEPMRALLEEALKRDPAATHAAHLLSLFDASNSSTKSRLAGNLLAEPLSEREIDVLRLLVSGLSGPEIASTLMVGTSTVKTHLKNIYGKLGVHNRVQAIQRARDLMIL